MNKVHFCWFLALGLASGTLFAQTGSHSAAVVAGGSNPATSTTTVVSNPNAPAPAGGNPPAPEAITTQSLSWPRQPWITLSKLPEVNYAVIQLPAMGWPTGAVGYELDDRDDVLALQESQPGPKLYLWQPGPQSALSVPLSVAEYNGLVGQVPTLSGTIVLPTHWKSLSSDGRVAGGYWPNTSVQGSAAEWSSVTSTTTTFGQAFSGIANVSYWAANATVVNSSGTALGWDYLAGWNGSGNNTTPVLDVGGINLSAGSVLGGSANSNYTGGTGLSYIPVGLNNANEVVALKSSPGSWSSPAELVILDGGTESPIGQATIINSSTVGLDFQSLTNGVAGATGNPPLVPPVLTAIQQSGTTQTPSNLVWTYKPASGTWSQPSTLQVWFSGGVGAQGSLVTPKASVGSAPWSTNDKLEMTLGDDRLIRNGTLFMLEDLMPAGWTVYVTQAINNSGVILASAGQTVDDSGNPIAEINQTYGPVLLVPAGLYVDSNHDGQMDVLGGTDDTSSKNPFVFWVNNGADGYCTVAGETMVQDALDPSANPLNNQANMVTCTRDLENFARLWVNLAAMVPLLNNPTNPITVGLEWHPADPNGFASVVGAPALDGAPSINLYLAAPATSSVTATGGTDYLTNSVSATLQATGTYSPSAGVIGNYGLPLGTIVAGGSPFYFPASTFANLTSAHPNAFFLFEGVARGHGSLVLTFNTGTPGNYTKIGEGPALYLNLKDIKEMYERWTVGDGASPDITGSGGGGAPNSSASISTDRLPAGVSSGASWTSASSNPVENNYILYVHGWNMHPWEKDAFAQTAFKRLYWQGYRGRFGTYQWPTTYHDLSVAGLFDFDASDFSAWQSALPLKHLLAQLRTTYSGQVYLFAHSHGNVVAGEALRLAAQSGGQLVKGYVATQAAIPVHVYDPSQPLPDGYFNTWRSPPGEPLAQVYPVGPQSPNLYIDSGDGNSNGWLAANSGATGTRTNFYNPNDYAFSRGIWETDQALKPDIRLSKVYYYSSFNLGTVADLFKTALAVDPVIAEGIIDAHSALIYSSLTIGDATNATSSNRYEIMAFAAEARCRALGTAAPTTSGWTAQGLQNGMGGVWPVDNVSTAQDYSEHPWHSAEFRFTNMEQGNYWNTLLGAFHLLNNSQ